jgi:hypothetical protein
MAAGLDRQGGQVLASKGPPGPDRVLSEPLVAKL